MMSYRKSMKMKFTCFLLSSCCSFLDGKDQRYNPKMSRVIPKDRWRKGSQVGTYFYKLIQFLWF